MVRAKEQSELQDLDRHEMTVLREVIAKPIIQQGFVKTSRRRIRTSCCRESLGSTFGKEWIREEEKINTSRAQMIKWFNWLARQY